MKKLLTAITATAMMVLSLLQGAPAQAWPDTTNQVNNMTSTDSRWDIGAVGKTLTSNMVFAYVGGEGGVNYIRSYTVSPEGNQTAPADIARTNNPNIYYQFNPSKSTWVDPAGTINLLYTKVDASQLVRTSSLLHVTSIDGITWTTPVVVATSTFRDADTCAQNNMDGCGIGQVSLSHTLTGQLVMIYAVFNADGSKQIYFTTKLRGKNWIAPAPIDSSNSSPFDLKIVSAGKGFVATWITSTGYGAPIRLMSAFSTGLTAKSWTAPQERRNTSDLRYLGFLQTSPTKYAVVYSEPTGTVGEMNIFSQTFDTRTNRFGAAQQILALTNLTYLHSVFATEYRGGQSALVFSSYSNSSDGNNARYILFRNGSASAQWLNQSLATPDDTYQQAQGASMDDLGHLSIVWVNNNPNTLEASVFLSQYYRGNRSDVLLAQDSGIYNVGFSPDGDVYASFFWNTTIGGVVRIRSDAPTLTTDVKVVGTPKVGKTLATKLPSIDPDSLLQRWLFSYQWYSCQYQVTEATNIETNNCAAISGATAATYKAKSTDKGKFLQVKLSVKSDNTTQVQYSASTLVVK